MLSVALRLVSKLKGYHLKMLDDQLALDQG